MLASASLLAYEHFDEGVPCRGWEAVLSLQATDDLIVFFVESPTPKVIILLCYIAIL